jgi:hypothetical protein
VKNLLSKSASERAISLVEVVFSMALVSVLFVSLYGGIASGFGLVNLARENLRANQIIVEKMETIRLYSWDQINSNGFIPASFTDTFFPTVITNVDDSTGQLRTNLTTFGNGGITYFGRVSMSDAPVADAYKTSMKQFTVTLTWTNSGIPRARSLTTYVSQNGMQNYVYY